jgi:transposase
MFGLTISEGAIANIFRRMGQDMATATSAIGEKLRSARIIASDETTTRTNGVIQWQWVFISDQTVLHKVAPSRARRVAAEVLGDHRSDRYAGQQDLAGAHQVCLAHVLRDVQYAIDCGDTIFAPTIRDHLRWAIGVGGRRHTLKDSTLVSYAAKADLKLSKLMQKPVAHPAGKTLLKQIKA